MRTEKAKGKSFMPSTETERRKQRWLMALNAVLGVAIAVVIGLRFHLKLYVTVSIAIVVLILLWWGLHTAARQFEEDI